MAFLKKINGKAKTDSNTGFGANATSYGGRFITKNGNANVKKTGIGFFDSISSGKLFSLASKRIRLLVTDILVRVVF